MRKVFLIAISLIAAPLFAAGPAQSIERDVVVSAPRAAVWKAWSSPEGAKTFFAPDARIELAPGGPYEIYFNPEMPTGSKGGESNEVLAFEPERMLLVTWNAPPRFGEQYRREHTYVLLRFDDAPGGGTRVRLTHFGWREGTEWTAIHDYFDQKGWDYVLGKFRKAYDKEVAAR